MGGFATLKGSESSGSAGCLVTDILVGAGSAVTAGAVSVGAVLGNVVVVVVDAAATS